MRLSARRLAPSRPARAPAPAFGLPLVTSGGQYFAHWPLQVLVRPWSCAHRYKVLPWASTRIRPRLLGATLTEALCAAATPGRASAATAAIVRAPAVRGR